MLLLFYHVFDFLYRVFSGVRVTKKQNREHKEKQVPHILGAEIITERRIQDAREDYLDCFGNFVPDVLSDCAACFVSSGGAGLYTVCNGTVAADAAGDT